MEAPLLVTGTAPTSEDDALLLCAGNQRVQTSTALLVMLSPVVLGGAIAAARRATRPDPANGDNGDPPQRGLLELPLADDTAASWLLALRLVHPLCAVDRPSPTWTGMKSVLLLADKYHISCLLAVCDKVLAGRPSDSFFVPESAEAVLDCVTIARGRGLLELEAACLQIISRKLQEGAYNFMMELRECCNHDNLPPSVACLILSELERAIGAKSAAQAELRQAYETQAKMQSALKLLSGGEGVVCFQCYQVFGHRDSLRQHRRDKHH